MDGLFEASFRENYLHPSQLQEIALQEKAVSKTLIPAMLQAAGLHNFPKNRLFELAQHFQPEEVHPEVAEKLLRLKQAFGVMPIAAAPNAPAEGA